MSVFLLTIIFPIFYTNECDKAIDPSEIRLNPGIFFPKANAESSNTTNCAPTSSNSNQQQSSYNSNQPSNAGYSTNQSATSGYSSAQSSTPSYSTNQPISTSNASASNIPSYSSSYAPSNYSAPSSNTQMPMLPSNMYQPNQMYMNNGYGIQPQQLQPPNGNQPVLTCDNTGEREAFKKCVADALKSLRNILENCRKTLGENAKECCINDECLVSLTGKKANGKKERDFFDESESKSNHEERPHRDFNDDRSYRNSHDENLNRRHSMNGSRRSYDDRDLYGPNYDRGDSLEEFIQFLQKRLKDGNQEEWDRKPPSNAIFDMLNESQRGDGRLNDRPRKNRGHEDRQDCKDICDRPNMDQYDRFKRAESDYGDLAVSRYENRRKNGRSNKSRSRRRKRNGHSEDGDGCKDVCEEHL